MIDRAGIIEDAAHLLLDAMSRAHEKGETFTASMSVAHSQLTRALATVPPALTDRAANHMPIERLRAVLEMQASPTIDRGDSHGARGQKGWIVYESSLPGFAEALAAVPPPSILERLRGMSEDERMSVFSEFCLHCGSDDPTCQCWNDE